MPMTGVEQVLQEHGKDADALFVFPTQVCRDRWADWLLTRLPEGAAGTVSLAMENFAAWDAFKRDAIRSVQQGHMSINAPLRSLFVEKLLRENARRAAAPEEEPIFFELVRPAFAQRFRAFVPWVASILPSLQLYLEATGQRQQGESRNADLRHKDLCVLEREYRGFLNENDLFESAWEKPPFDARGKRVFLFFPELLEDYATYAPLLEPQIIRISVSENNNKNESSDTVNVIKAETGREMVRLVTRFVRHLVDEGAAWDDIAVSMTDPETYEAYLLREFALYAVPVVDRMGKPLASYAAGTFFPCLASCVKGDFAFADLSKLLLNPALPWKDETVIHQLMAFGAANKCIASWEEEGRGRVDPWLDAFQGLGAGQEERARTFYEELKKAGAALVHARSFGAVRRAYFAFRKRFFNEAEFTGESDSIFGRAMAELADLITLEQKWPVVTPTDPYGFFADQLKATVYVPKQDRGGVSLFPYKLAAGSPYAYHLVVGASQKGLTTVHRRLSFLSKAERGALGLGDEDASKDFIRHYAAATQKSTTFFWAQEDFSGYGIAHSELRAFRGREEKGTEGGAYLEEQGALRGEGAFPSVLFQTQKEGFSRWAALSGEKTARGSCNPVDTSSLLQKCFGTGELVGRVRVSASRLKDYALCPRKWFNSAVLGLSDWGAEDEVVSPLSQGTVYHRVLERFFRTFRESRAPLPSSVSGEGEALLRKSIDLTLADLGQSADLSPLGVRLVQAQRDAMELTLAHFFCEFLRYFAGHIVAESEKSYQLVPPGAVYYLTGRVDLVLTNNEGDTVIVDFKSGGMPAAKDCDGTDPAGLQDFQLPFYTLLVGHPGTALFFSIKKAEPQVLFGALVDQETGKPKGRKEPIVPGDEAYGRIMEAAQSWIERFVLAVSTGEVAREAANLPDGTAWTVCKECNYRFSCRTTYRV